MFCFADLIESDDDVREVRQRFPASIPVFDHFGIRAVCHDCPIVMAAQRAEVSPYELVEALNRAVFQGESGQGS